MKTVSIFDLFYLICGLAIFLYGMQQGEKNLKRISSSNLKKILASITRNRIIGYFSGFFTTILTQSSSATTVLLVSLASAHLLTFGQSLGIILGADLATTLTVQLFAFKFQEIAPLLIASGFFLSTTKKNEFRVSGKLLLAVGFIFFGMQIMSDATKPFRSLPWFINAVEASFENPWIGITTTLLFTSIIQSSAATLAIVISLAQAYNSASGAILNYGNFVPLVLGANLGTCVTAFLSTFGAAIEGKRVAWAHFLFKFIGTLCILPFITLFDRITLFNGPYSFQIAAAHTSFNLFIAIIFLPFLTPFGKLIEKIFTEKKSKHASLTEAYYLNDQLLSFPVLALSQALKEIERMGTMVLSMLDQGSLLLSHFDYHKKKWIENKDDEVDFLHEQIVIYLTHMAREELNPDQASRAYELIMVTTDIEHVGDLLSKNIVLLLQKIESSPLPLSVEGRNEIADFFSITKNNLQEALAAFTMNDHSIARMVFDRKDEQSNYYEKNLEMHMTRLYKRNPQTLQTTSIHSDLLEEINRINYFAFRIAAHILRIHKAE